MSTTPATPADPALTDATGLGEALAGDPAETGRPRRGRLHGFRALRWPGFRIYMGSMLLRGMSMWMPMVAIPWLAVQLGATPAEVGIVSAFFFLPTVFVGPFGGVLADRVERLRVIVGTQAVAAVASLLLFLLVASGSESLPLLAAATFVLGLLVALEVPVRQSFMTELVPAGDISSAASLHATAFNTTRLLGPVLAGLLIAAFGSASPFLFTFASALLVVGAFLWMDRYREPGRQRADTSHSVRADLREGVAFVLGEPSVRWSAILLGAAVMFGISAFMTLAPLFATGELSLAADGYGAFIGMTGAGGLTAALLVTIFAHGDRRPWLITGVLAMSALVAGIAITQLTVLVFGLAFLLGASQITLAQNALVSVQTATPDMLRGRVMGIWVMTFQGSSLVGAFLSGGLADLLGVRGALLVSAVALAVVGSIAAFALRRVEWRLKPAALASA